MTLSPAQNASPKTSRLALTRGGSGAWELGSGPVVLLVAAWLCLLCNTTFWQQVFASYPLTMANLPFLGSLAFVLLALTSLLLLAFDFPYVLKVWLTVILLSASIAAYFMDSYHVVLDQDMLQNAFLTDAKEVRDLLNLRLFATFLLLGVLPSVLLWRLRIRHPGTLRNWLLHKLKYAGALLVLMAVALFSLGGTYASFFREHKPIRGYANPSFLLYSFAKFASVRLAAPVGPLSPLGEDARIVRTGGTRKLLIMVVGESARADHFSLNGYPRETNPLLGKEKVVSFTRMYSWGTSTANAVPCMFTTLDQKTYSERRVRSSENLLDLLQRVGVQVLWRDNNSDSKGIATRVPYEDFKTGAHRAAGEEETRDVEMLKGLQDHVKDHPTGDLFIVLHQMGNHGPAYYKRYPAAFEKFTPIQRTNELGKCTQEELDNAYDNALLYTDHFLAQVIAFLKQNEGPFETAMLYSSDHGESLGEQGIYLHGLPYVLAPEAQKRVATVFWFSDNFSLDRPALEAAKDLRLTHTSLFHTVLGLLGIQTKVYDPRLDLTKMAAPVH
jgi:lipid A ethanolaminephosphotransferase